MQAERIGSHFSNNGPINLISCPDCYICKDASVDTHIEATYVLYLSSVIADICRSLVGVWEIYELFECWHQLSP